MSNDGKGIIIAGSIIIVISPIFFVLRLFINWLPKNVILAGYILILIGVIFIAIGIYQRKLFLRETEIRDNGIDARARLVNWWILGKDGGDLSAEEYCKFELEVTIEGKPPYKLIHRQLVPFGIYNQLSRGMILLVKVHQDKPERVILIF